ncbi:hypothetical protein JB92DRAFT_830876 [Gautieria morchelliformis]|nr:hypothetical protein JB92DRAFT_830876 [Gautieria morchelliformis]
MRTRLLLCPETQPCLARCDAHDRRSHYERQSCPACALEYFNQLDAMAALTNLGIVANVIAVLQLTVSNIGVCSEYVAGVKNAPRDRERIMTELEGLYVVLTQVFQLANEETGRTSQLESGRASRLSALNERLHVCGDEMKRLRTALGGEMESFEMGNLETRPDSNVGAALGREMEGLGKDLGRKGGMQALMWPLKEAEVDKTVDSIRKLKDSLIMAMEVDQAYVAFTAFDMMLTMPTDA